MDRHARCVQSVDTVLPGHSQGVPADRGAREAAYGEALLELGDRLGRTRGPPR
jgi:hypothetical protein